MKRYKNTLKINKKNRLLLFGFTSILGSGIFIAALPFASALK